MTEPSPIKAEALSLKLPVRIYDKAGAAETLEAVRALEPDFLVVVSFGFLLSGAMLAAPKLAPLNIHPSLLPRHRGASPMPWTLLEGDVETGVTVIRMNERMDAGPIVSQVKTEVLAGEDLTSLEARLAALGAELIVRTLDRWGEVSAHAAAQDESRATYTRKFNKEDARLDFSLPAAVLERRVRALRGWPGTFAAYAGKRLLVHRAAVVPGSGKPGTVLACGDAGIAVAAGESALLLQTVQLEGKKALSAGEFLRGFPIAAGRTFE
jgi:methionyl-tRNA formyltransferase